MSGVSAIRKSYLFCLNNRDPNGQLIDELYISYKKKFERF